MRIAAAVVALALLVGCQPTILRTETRFIPPTEPEQLACIGRCDQANGDCLKRPSAEPVPISAGNDPVEQAEAERVREEYDQCSRDVQAEYEQCEMANRSQRGRNTCYKPVCLVKGKLPAPHNAPEVSRDAPDEAACARIYKACYERCGGRIESIETCEGDC